MEIDKLKTFVDLAHTLSFSETAENLYTSQSTVSKQIKALEKKLGHNLFERTNKSVKLSSYGELILDDATKIVVLQDNILKKTAEFRSKVQNQINIGIIPTFSNYDIFEKVMSYQGNHPNVRIVLHELETNQLVKLLDEEKLDLIFTRSMHPDTDNGSYDKIKIEEEQFKVCLRSDHPLAAKDRIPLKDLEKENFIMLAKNSLLYEPVIDLCNQAGFKPRISFVSDRISSVLRMVKSGQGIAILMHPDIDDKNVLFKEIEPTATSTLLFLKNRQKSSKTINDFWNYLQEFAMPERNN